MSSCLGPSLPFSNPTTKSSSPPKLQHARQQGARRTLTALYLRAPRLFDELSVCHADGSFRKRLAAIAKVNLLVIDDFAIAPIGPRERSDLLEILDDRVGARATLITSQLPSNNGTTTSAIPPWPMPSSIGSSIAPTRSAWLPMNPCARAPCVAAQQPRKLTERDRIR